MRTQQIFINLISNAIKFSKPGDKIRFEVCRPVCLDEASSKFKFAFKVVDQGMGLNEADRKKLFTPFFKSSCEANRQANTNSNGIGLSVCKKIA